MFLNLSNHPIKLWGETQKSEALKYGKLEEIPFPPIDPQGDEIYIKNLASDYLHQILEVQKSTNERVTVHLMGELNFTFTLINMLKINNIDSIASTTDRCVIEESDGSKHVVFTFVRYRKY